MAPVTADWVNQIAKPEPTTPASPTEVIEAQEELEQPQKEDHDQAEDETEKKYDQGLEKSRNGFGARLNRSWRTSATSMKTSSMTSKTC